MQKEKQRVFTLKLNDLEEYIELRKFKPLSPAELTKGKDHLRISNTDALMPWTTIYTRLSSGQPIHEVIYQYGQGRKLALWALEDGILLDETLEQIVEQEAQIRDDIQEIAADTPEVALTLLQRVNELCPDFQTNVATFADKMVQKAISKLNEDFIEAADMEKLANAVQKTTDIIGVTQRHASGVQISNTTVQVEGFKFVLDAPPPKVEAIEAEVE